MNYGDVALGVECALPADFAAGARAGRVRKLLRWLGLALAIAGVLHL